MKKVLGKNADGTWNGLVTFTFDGLDAITFDSAKASAECEQAALANGWMQRLGDMAAIPRTAKDGSVIDVTEAMRREAVLTGVQHYESGTTDWNLRAQSRPAPQNPTILAIASKLGCTYAEAEAEVAKRMLADMGA